MFNSERQESGCNKEVFGGPGRWLYGPISLGWPLGDSGGTQLWVLRSQDGSNFYQGKLVQKIQWPSLSSATAIEDTNGAWLPWIIPTSLGSKPVIAPDVATDGFWVLR